MSASAAAPVAGSMEEGEGRGESGGQGAVSRVDRPLEHGGAWSDHWSMATLERKSRDKGNERVVEKKRKKEIRNLWWVLQQVCLQRDGRVARDGAGGRERAIPRMTTILFLTLLCFCNVFACKVEGSLSRYILGNVRINNQNR